MKKTVLITGASSGIGYELTKRFAQDGYDLVLVARDRQRLEQLASELAKQYGVSTKVMPQDLAKPTAPDEIFTMSRRHVS
jgi:short-subunit dehydrogenase